jgi:hypothetical protein
VAGDRLPPGAPYHVAGPTEDGWGVVDVWESQEALQRFFDHKLNAALQRAEITARPQVFSVARIMQP